MYWIGFPSRSRWANVFTPQLTADDSRFMGGEPIHITREQAAEYGQVAVSAFTRVQPATATTVRIHFKNETQAQVMACAEVAHDFTLGGVQQAWTIVARYTHDVVKTIEEVLLDPVHYRGNPWGWSSCKASDWREVVHPSGNDCRWIVDDPRLALVLRRKRT